MDLLAPSPRPDMRLRLLRPVMALAASVLLARAADPPAFDTADYENDIQQMISALYDSRNADVERSLTAMEKVRPGFPAPLVYRSLYLSWKAADDPGNANLVNQFLTASDKAIQASTDWTRQYPADADGWRYLASALGQRTQFAVSVVPSATGALRYGLKARAAVDKAFALDMQNKDILIGVGGANFFLASMPLMVRFVARIAGIHGGNRELGLNQIEEGMNEGPHSHVEGAMVLAAAWYSEANYPSFHDVVFKHILTPHPKLAAAGNWDVTGCLCGRMFEQARNTVKATSAGEGWQYFQNGRIALAQMNSVEAEQDFSQAIEKGLNVSYTSWAWYGKALARKQRQAPSGDEMRRAKAASSGAFSLSERLFRTPGSCPH